MRNLSTVAAFAAASAILTACGGQNGAVPGTQNAPASTHATPVGVAGPSSFTFKDDNGRLVHYFPTRQDARRIQSAVPPPQSNLLYNGGSIQPNPKIYVIYWGSVWNSTGDPDGVRALLNSFYSGWNGASWPSTMTQYYGPSGTNINDDTTLGNTWVDTGSSPPTHPGNTAVANEAKRGAAHFKDFSINASYVVALPHGHDPSPFGVQWCAWHSDESATGGIIQYTDLPYMPDAGFSCGEGSVNNPGVDDGVTIVGGHEQAETETDPRPCSGWCDSSGNEIGDKCAWQNLQNTAFTNGTYPTQPLWSNKNGGCVQ